MNKIKFEDIPIHSYGNTLEIAGMLLSGQEGTFVVPFAKEDTDDMKIIQMTEQNWIDMVKQLDTLDTKQFPNDPSTPIKAIIRKSQRQIEQGVSWKVFKRDGYCCQYCGTNDAPLTVDHIVLWEDLGASVEGNLISACRKCNKLRGNIPFMQWIESATCEQLFRKNFKHEYDFLAGFHIDHLKDMYKHAITLPKRAQQRSR